MAELGYRAVWADSARCVVCRDFTYITIRLPEVRVQVRMCDPCREGVAGVVIDRTEREADSPWLRARDAVLEGNE